MTIRMKNLDQLTLVEMKEFISTNRHVGWSAVERGAVYGLVERVLQGQQYRKLSKGQKGIVRRFLAKVTAVSRAQMTRLIRRWMETRHVERKPPQRPHFRRRYTSEDITLLADFRRPAVRATGEDLAVPYLQPAEVDSVSEDSHQRTTHSGAAGLDWGAAPTRPTRPGRIPARGYGASRSARWPTGRVPHQCRGYGYAMAGGRLHRDHQRTASDPGVRGDVASVSFSYPGVPLRQRVGVSEPHGSEIVEQTAGGGVHEIAGVPLDRQRSGGRQERSGNPQADRLRADRQRACRSLAEVLHGLLQSLPEFSSALRVCDRGDKRARQAETELSSEGLSHAVREANLAGGLGEVLKAGDYPHPTPATGDGAQRHGGGAADAKSQNRITDPLSPAAMRGAVEMPGLWKA